MGNYALPGLTKHQGGTIGALRERVCGTTRSLTLAGAVLVVVGCSDSSEAPVDEPWVHAVTIAELIQDAQEANASEQQISILQRWLEIRDTPYSDVGQALQRFGQCLDDAGLDYSLGGPVSGVDYPELSYRVYDSASIAPEESLALTTACEDREIYFVSVAYQLGPGVSQRRQLEDAEHLPFAVQCLESHGVVTDEVATLDELEAQLAESGVVDQWSCTVAPYEVFG